MKLEKLVKKLNTKFIGDGGALKVKIIKYSIANLADPYYGWFEREVARFCVGGSIKETVEHIYMDGKEVDDVVKGSGKVEPYLAATDGKCNYFEILKDGFCEDKFVARINKNSVVIYDTTKYGDVDRKVMIIEKI